jgi:threonine/homoserine/homoserine lactone efflux protein
MLPGPATALLIREVIAGDDSSGPAREASWARRVARGRIVGVIGGIEVGIFAWAVFSGLGVAALVAASTMAYTVLRTVGAVVLVLLGLQTLWYSRSGRAEQPRPLMRLRGFRGGLLTNLANPKAAVFAFAFYPQFIPHGSNVLLTSVLLGAVHVLVDILWYSLLASVVSTARDVFARSAVRRWLERAVGAVLIALGLRLAAE